MAIFKSSETSDYVVIPNKTAQDSSLSWEARGMLCMMLSLPSDWAIHISWLVEQSPKCKRDKVMAIIKELVDCGYIVKSQGKGDDGKFSGNDYSVFSKNDNRVGNSVNGKTVNGKTDTTKETLLQKKDNINISESETHQQPPADKTKNNYDKIVDAYHEILPAMPAVREITASRKTKIKNFMSKYRFNLTDWEGYLKYIADNCTWMFERRPRGRDGETFWKAKNLDFLLTEKCYLGVREGRYDDNN